MIYSFVLDDSLTSLRFTTRTEQLTKSCEPLQKMRVRLGACKTGLSTTPSNFILLIVPRQYFCCGFNCFVFWSRIFVLFEPYVRFHIFSSVRVTERPPIGEWLLTRLTICFLGISTCVSF